MTKCRENDRYAASRLAAFVREVLDDQIAVEALVDERNYEYPVRDIVPITSLQDRRINAYRVRLVEVAGWRLITAVDHRTARVGLLAVMERDQNYEDDRELWRRIEGEYDEYGFHRY